MELSRELLNSFAKITNDQSVKKEDTVKGVIVISNGQSYVKIDGSEILTPIDSTTGLKADDRVLVMVKDHKATIIGNYTDPSASTSVVSEVSANAQTARSMALQATESANQAQIAAGEATTAANTAQQQATAATTAANTAQQQATAATTAANTAQQQATAATTAANSAIQQAYRANKYANSALDQLGIVQDVVGVLSWASEHGSFTKTADQELQNGKVYFTYDGTDYTPVITPDAAQLSNYYELTVNEAMQSYIMAHLAVTNRGLWVLPSGINTGTVTPETGETEADARARLGANYKVLLSNSGMIVYDGTGVEVASYGESIEFNSSRPQYIGGEDAYIIFYDADHDDIPDSIRIGGDNVFIGSNKKLSDVLTTIDAVDNLEIGGKNLLTGTNSTAELTATGYREDHTWRTAGSGVGATTSVSVTDCPDKSITIGWKFDVTSVPNEAYSSARSIGQNRIPIIAGQEYTLSCYAKGTGKLYMFYGISSFAPVDLSGKIDITSEWKRYSVTFTAESGTAYINANGSNVFFGILGTDVTGYICGMKLETGNKLTDWSPAPEDLEALSEEARNIAEDAANASESLNEDIYGEPFYQYTVNGVTYDVWKAEDGNYYYDDGSGTDHEVDAASLDQDEDGYIVVRHGGIQDTVEKIAGSVLVDTVEPSVIIQARHTDDTNERTAAVKITDERVSFKKNGEEVAYIDSNEEEGVIDINNARIHVSLRIGQLEIFDHDGGIGVRRYD